MPELNERVSDERLAEMLGHYRKSPMLQLFDKDTAALLTELQQRRASVVTPDSVTDLFLAAWAEADKAMRKFPQPNYVISKVAEEAGEVVKAAIHCAEGRDTPEHVVAEIKQAMAMLIRLFVEGDQVHGLPPLTAALSVVSHETVDGEKEGEDDHATDWQGLGLDVIEYRHKNKLVAPTDETQGVKRKVTAYVPEPINSTSCQMAPVNEQTPPNITRWVSLSQLEAVERERDEFETGLVQMHRDLSAAEASLAAMTLAMRSVETQAESAAWNIGKPGHKFTDAEIQAGYFNIRDFARTALAAEEVK